MVLVTDTEMGPNGVGMLCGGEVMVWEATAGLTPASAERFGATAAAGLVTGVLDAALTAWALARFPEATPAVRFGPESLVEFELTLW
ncbi:hypothetical protein CIW47_07055 [Mycolicibacterium sp. P1-5]|nr:hypothetical protein CIW47_07055 [Mycolicibacterium sp. P1-5]